MDSVFEAHEKIKLPPDLSDASLKLLHLRGKLDSKRKKLQDNYDLQKEINELVDEIYEVEDLLGMHIIEH